MGYFETLPPDLDAAIETWANELWVQFAPDSSAFTATFTLAQLEELGDYVNLTL